MAIQQRMEGFRSLRQLCQRTLLERLCEPVKQRPDIPPFEFLMLGFTPFMEHRRDETIAAHPNVCGTDDDVMSLGIVDGTMLVGGEPGALVMPLVHQPADPLLNKARKIPHDEAGMFAGQFDLA